jgi:hypothetical protein
MWQFLLSLFRKSTTTVTKKTRNELMAMDKRALEAHARHYGVELDRRKKKETLVNETLQAQIRHNTGK